MLITGEGVIKFEDPEWFRQFKTFPLIYDPVKNCNKIDFFIGCYGLGYCCTTCTYYQAVFVRMTILSSFLKLTILMIIPYCFHSKLKSLKLLFCYPLTVAWLASIWSDCRLECEARGEPPPSVFWTREKDNITVTHRSSGRRSSGNERFWLWLRLRPRSEMTGALFYIFQQ